MDKHRPLPKRLKSGRRLVATAAERQVGLYRMGGIASLDYRILLPNRKVVRGNPGERGYPLPPEGRWVWRAGRKPGRGSLVGKGTGGRTGKRRGASSTTKPFEVSLAIPRQLVEPTTSKIHLCVDCEVDVRRKTHSHTVRALRGSAEAICCKCVRKRGARCSDYDAKHDLVAATVVALNKVRRFGGTRRKKKSKKAKARVS